MFLAFPQFSKKTPEKVYSSNFSRHLRAVNVVDSEKLAYSPLSDTEKAFKKYYGKRVTKLIQAGKVSFIGSSKRCKILKTFRARMCTKNNCPPKSITNLQILYEGDLYHDQKTMSILRGLSQYKRLENADIRIRSEFFLELDTHFIKQVQRLNNLQSLSLILTENQILSNLKYILSLQSLKTLKLTSTPTEDLSENLDKQQRLFDCYSKILKSKRLQSVDLELESLAYKSSFVNIFLQEIGQTNLPYFKIFLPSSFENPKSTQDLETALNNIDQLLVKFMEDEASIYFICNTSKDPNMSLSQAKRILELCLYTDPIHAPLESRQEATPVIKDLNQLFENIFGPEMPLMPDMSTPMNLKKLSLDFRELSEENFSQVVSSLVDVLKGSNALEHLVLSCLMLTNKNANVNLNLCQQLFTEISNLKTLTCLEITSFIQNLELMELSLKPILHLENLTKFSLKAFPYFQSINNMTIDFLIEFPEHSKLTELYIKLPNINLESNKNFIKTIAKLSNLKKLQILEGSWLFTDAKCRKMLIKALFGLTKLKKIVIGDDQPSFRRTLVREQSEIEKTKKIEELRDCAKNLLNENKGLERVQFIEKDSFDIRYKRC